VPALGALAAVLLAGTVGFAAAAGAATSDPSARPPSPARSSDPAPQDLITRHRPAVAFDSVAAAPSVAESAAPRSSEPQLLFAVAIASVTVAPLLGARLGRRRGSTLVIPGTGSTSTRGPPVLQPA
jgi:hypothetical protein